MLIDQNHLFYTAPELDRASHQRKNDQWITAQITTPDSRFILVHKGRNLFTQETDGLLPAFLQGPHVNDLIDTQPWAFLGELNTTAVFVIDVSALDEEPLLHRFGPNYLFENLRQAGRIENRTNAAQMAYGKGLMYWHERHQFCGVCGSPTKATEAGHVRKCQNDSCGIQHFPRTDPAVIMLVVNGDNCLLGHASRHKPGMYSTLAGFVEPGETIEDAVRREVFEEVGVRTGKVTYAGSQPWPFPTALMLGFYAEAETTDITIDEDELIEARWFTKDEIRNFQGLGKSLPTHDSIARNLIENWVK